eukprot:TRINITY_DN16024_c0_g1_i1.p1 TRINITY_DN16024_c0_g1~~TRINITY_DN16024_c0_g1_i1.p1  ORF type:complete len:367 (+),score=61.24 TRINITY_DN16024_c0_g1_i1:522-1622(+)
MEGAAAAGSNVRTPSDATHSAGVPRPVAEAEEEENEEEGDEGPFFDMEFTVRDEGDGDGEDEYDGDGSSVETDEERRFGYAVSAGGSHRNLGSSPSDDLFFKGKLVPVDPSEAPSPNSRPPQFPVSLLRSATKIRVFLLGFKKPKPPAGETGQTGSPQKQQQSRLFTVKLKVEEVPIVSLFTRENSSRCSTGKPEKRQAAGGGGVSASDARRFAKVVMQKYLKVIKPLYVRASRRHGDKARFSGQLSPTSTATIPEDAAPAPANVKGQKQGNLPAGLRVACRHLGKSRSASAAVAAMPAMTLQSQSQRRDDSLLQQQDGIQSAIAHCKKSFNASSKELEISLPRSCSDPSANACFRNSSKGKEAYI